MAEIGILIVGHGTRRSTGLQQFRMLVRGVAEQLAGSAVEGAFLELARPDLGEAIERLAERGMRRIGVVPALLFAAGHARSDIPAMAEQHARRLGIDVCGYAEPLEFDPAGIAVSIDRCIDAVRECNPAGQELWEADRPSGTPTRIDPLDQGDAMHRRLSAGVGDPRSDNGWNLQRPIHGGWSDELLDQCAVLLVGRGSSDRRATGAFRRWCRRRAAAQGISHWRCAFLHGAEPALDAGLQWLERGPWPVCVLQPHLLFDGQLMDRLREAVESRRDKGSGRMWGIARELGPDPRILAAFARKAKNLAQTEQRSTDGGSRTVE